MGSFGLAGARSVESLRVLPMARAVQHLVGVRVGPEVAAEAANGRVLDLSRLGVAGDGPWAVHGVEGELLAVYEPFRDVAKPSVVVAGEHPRQER